MARALRMYACVVFALVEIAHVCNADLLRGAQVHAFGDDSSTAGSASASGTASSSPSTSPSTAGSSSLFAPLSTEPVPPKIFASTDGHKRLLPPRFLAPGIEGSKAIPTNNWWGNMIASSNDSNVSPVWASPYTLRPALATAPFGLDVSYPYPTRVIGGTSGNGNASKFYLHSINRDFTFSASEFASAPSYHVVDWDDLSVSVRFFAAKTAGQIEATLMSGMAYVTATYTALTPVFSVGTNAILTVNGAPTTSSDSFTDSRFLLTLKNGTRSVLYTSKPLTLRPHNGSDLLATEPFSGIARFAVVTSDKHLAALDAARDCVIYGANVQASDADAYSFVFNTSGDCSSGMLHFLQTHHVETLDVDSAGLVLDVAMHSTTRGALSAVRTKTTPPTMTFRDSTDIPIEFYPPRNISASDVQSLKLHDILLQDIDGNWSLATDGSYYFNGKLAQKFASLCLLANLDVITGADQATAKRTCLNKLELILQLFLSNSWTYPLQYDSVYRGIVSSQGFAKNDVNLDFGNTMYNDHHYHYGYWIMATAIVNYLDPEWPSLSALNKATLQLVRDVVNPSDDDPHFPKFRQFDWYRGHSYSHGITPFADGKDQESSSEEINFHYAVMLFGKATQNRQLQQLAKLMLKLNLRAIQTYFLMTSASQIHPPSIVPNKVMGILFDNKADYASWFSSDPLQIHGIQMIPISPITELVRSKLFVQEEWDQVLSKQPAVLQPDANRNNTWLSLAFANYATVDKTTALRHLQVVALDDGLTRSWALYMAATRA